MAKFKIKKKPSEPTKRSGFINVDLYDFFNSYKDFTLDELIQKINDIPKDQNFRVPYECELLANIHVNDLRFRFEDTNDYYDCSSRYSLMARVPYQEIQKYFDKRMAEYEKNLAAYEQWKKDNKENIIAYEREQAIKKEEKRKKAEEKKQRDAEHKKEQLQKDLERIQKQLENMD